MAKRASFHNLKNLTDQGQAGRRRLAKIWPGIVVLTIAVIRLTFDGPAD
jgi:hypothetical protein